MNDQQDKTREALTPCLYAHELLKNGRGIWLACGDLSVVQRAHDPGETGEEILHLVTVDQAREFAAAATSAQEARIARLREALERLLHRSENEGWAYSADEREDARAALKETQPGKQG